MAWSAFTIFISFLNLLSLIFKNLDAAFMVFSVTLFIGVNAKRNPGKNFSFVTANDGSVIGVATNSDLIFILISSRTTERRTGINISARVKAIFLFWRSQFFLVRRANC